MPTKSVRKKTKKTASNKKSAKKKTAKKRSARARSLANKRMAFGIKNVGPLRLAAVVSRGRVDMGVAWHTLLPLAKERGLTGQALAAFALADASSGPVWYAAGVVVDEDYAIAAPMEELRVPQSSYAAWTFVGTFDHLTDAWGGFQRHVSAAGGHRIDYARPFLEIYTSDGKRSVDKKPRTELCVPV